MAEDEVRVHYTLEAGKFAQADIIRGSGMGAREITSIKRAFAQGILELNTFTDSLSNAKDIRCFGSDDEDLYDSIGVGIVHSHSDDCFEVCPVQPFF